MMRRLMNAGVAVVLTVAAALLLGGCFALTTSPIYDVDTLTGDDGLAGVWMVPDDNETWEFVPAKKASYRLIVHDTESELGDSAGDGVFVVRMAKIGGRLYLDVFPEPTEARNEFQGSHLVRAHSVWLYEREGDTMRLGALTAAAIDEVAVNGAVIPRVDIEGSTLLTGEREALQAMLEKHSDALFPEMETLVRVR